jgi:hypothetical protein
MPESLVGYLVRYDGHAHRTVLGCEWAIGDHIESLEKGCQRRRFLAREPRLNGLRRNP